MGTNVNATKIAIMGGKPTIVEKGKIRKYSNDVIDKVIEYMGDEGKLSIAGKEGVIDELENVFQEKYGQKYAVALSSGTNAIFSAFFAINIKKGDEVIAPVYGFHACISSVYLLGGVPVFCDCEKNGVNMDCDKLEKLITLRTKAIVVVHNWGAAADIERIVEIAHKYKLYVIEDCSHAHGSEYKNQTVGRFGDIAIFSLQANKTVYAGEGGIFLTSNKVFYERAILLGRYRGQGYLEELNGTSLLETGYGLKFRMHPIGAVIALQTFKEMEKVICDRKYCVDIIERVINKSKIIRPLHIPEYVTKHSYYGYKLVFISEDENLNDMYIKALRLEGVDIHRSSYVINTELELFDKAKKSYTLDVINAKTINAKLVSLQLPEGDGCIEIAHLYALAFEKVEKNIENIIKLKEKKI